MSLEILNPGVQSLIQDSGRFGLARYGVPRSGAFDHAAYAQGNLLVGNNVPGVFEPDPGPAVIEVLLGGLRVQTDREVLVAVTGACGALTVLDHDTDDKREVQPHRPFVLTAGSRLHIGAPRVGIRAYLAVAGGITTAYVLGSRSTDTSSGIGPAPLGKGQLVPTGTRDMTLKSKAQLQLEAQNQPDFAGVVTFLPGPHTNLLEGGANALSTVEGWTVNPTSGRSGVRLTPANLNQRVRTATATLPSEATLAGAIQALPSGELVVLGPDGPTTGGYPVVAVLDRNALDSIAQARPGAHLQLVQRSS